MGAYEALSDKDGASFKTIYEKLSRRPDTVPSDLVEPSRVERYRLLVRRGDGKGECLALRGEGVWRSGLSKNQHRPHQARRALSSAKYRSRAHPRVPL